jgi:hypothetical protein
MSNNWVRLRCNTVKLAKAPLVGSKKSIRNVGIVMQLLKDRINKDGKIGPVMS